MEQETGLSRYWQRKARKILRSHSVIEEYLRGIPRRLWYRVDLEALLRIMESPHSTMNQWKRKQDADDASEHMNTAGYYSEDHIIDRSCFREHQYYAAGCISFRGCTTFRAVAP